MEPTPKTTHLLYLHGFRSSPHSSKARMMAAYVEKHHPAVTWWCPQLPASPKEAMELLQAGTRDWPAATMAVVGSSLGGFYAAAVAQGTGCKAVLLNPAVYPARDLEKYVGDLTSYHDPEEHFVFEACFVQELRDLEFGPLIRPEQFYALIAKGDEVLDWREMLARYGAGQVRLLEGGDHAISDFAVHLPEVLAHLQLA